MIKLLYFSAFAALGLSGAIFGFFYAWVCSTMWGLDSADPAIAIAAMQAMNGSVRNAVFAPAFFGTPIVLLTAASLSGLLKRIPSAVSFGAAALVYCIGGLALTLMINVPMNEALAMVVIPDDPAAARLIWQNYSSSWQFWNTVRMIASGVTLLFTGLAFLRLNRSPATANQTLRSA